MRTMAFLACVAAAAPAPAEELRIGPDSGENLVVFESSAPMESFEGRTSRVTGSVALDPASVGETIALAVEVDMASLDTGIGMRNTHMRENHLHTGRFPTAVFTAAKVVEGAGAILLDGKPHEVRVQGEMKLHGVTRTIEVPLRLTRVEDPAGPKLHIESRFDIALTDYDIPRPRFLVMKLNEVQKVRVDVWAAPAPQAPGGGTEAAS